MDLNNVSLSGTIASSNISDSSAGTLSQALTNLRRRLDTVYPLVQKLSDIDTSTYSSMEASGNNYVLTSGATSGNVTTNVIASGMTTFQHFDAIEVNVSNGASTHATPVQVEVYGDADGYTTALNGTTKFTIDPTDPVIRFKRQDTTDTATSNAQTSWTMTAAGAMPALSGTAHGTILAQEVGVASIITIKKSVTGSFDDEVLLRPVTDYTVDYSTRTATVITLTSSAASDIVSGQSKLKITWIADVADLDATVNNAALKLKFYLNRTDTGETSPSIQPLSVGSSKYVELRVSQSGFDITFEQWKDMSTASKASILNTIEADKGATFLHYLAGSDAATAASVVNHANLTAASAASIFDSTNITAAMAATVINNSNLTAANAATIINHANLTAAKAASIMDSANLTAANAVLIVDHANLTAARAAAIFDSTNITAAMAATIFNNSNLTTAKAASIMDHANLTASRAAAVIEHFNLTVAKVDSIVDSSNITSARIKAFLDTGSFTDVDKIAALLDGTSLTAADAATHVNAGTYTTANLASAFNSSQLAAAKGASIMNSANLTAANAAAIIDHDNLTSANAALILDNSNLTADNTQSIMYAMSDYDKQVDIIVNGASDTTFSLSDSISGTSRYGTLTVNNSVTLTINGQPGVIIANTLTNNGTISKSASGGSGGSSSGDGDGGVGGGGLIIVVKTLDNNSQIQANGGGGASASSNSNCSGGGGGGSGSMYRIGIDVLGAGGTGGGWWSGGRGAGNIAGGGGSGGTSSCASAGAGGGVSYTSYNTANDLYTAIRKATVDYWLQNVAVKSPTSIQSFPSSTSGGGIDVVGYTPSYGNSGGGGGGGGQVIVVANSLDNADGTIQSNGGSGGNHSGGSYSGGGGGGGGGFVYAMYRSTLVSAGTVTASGGGGGSGYGTAGSGSAGTATTYDVSGADVAEYYGAGEESVGAGDVVSVSSILKPRYPLRVKQGFELPGVGAGLGELYSAGGLTPSAGSGLSSPDGGEVVKVPRYAVFKSREAYDRGVLGIVATNPAITIGPNDGSSVPVALVGRVPVKIDPDSEPIRVGDPVTASGKPGYAMKATRAGLVIGKALERWSCNSSTSGDPLRETPDVCKDKIMVFVNLGWWDPDVYLTETGSLKIRKTSSEARLTSGDSQRETPDVVSPEASGAARLGVVSPDEVDLKTLMDKEVRESFEVVDSEGRKIERVGVFAELVSGKGRFGSIEAEEILVEGKGLKEYILGLLGSDSKAKRPTAYDALLESSPEATETGKVAQLETHVLGELSKIALEEAGLASDSAAGDRLASPGRLTSDVEEIKRPTLSSSPSASLAEVNDTVKVEEAVSLQQYEDLNLGGSLNVLGTSTFADLSVTGSLQVGLLSISGLTDSTSGVCWPADSKAELSTACRAQLELASGVSLETLAGPLKLQENGLGNLEVFGGKIVLDAKGDLVVEGTVEAEEIKAREKLCIGETCLTEEELKQLLEGVVTPTITLPPSEQE